MKIKKPELNSKSFDRSEARYLVHCANIAIIIAHSSTVNYAKAKIREYVRITNAEHEE